MLERISFEKWKVPDRRFHSSGIGHFQILDPAHLNPSLLSDGSKKLLPLEGNAHPTGSIREDPPVVICLTVLGKTEGEKRLKLVFFAVESEEIRVVFVVPGLWIEQRDLLLCQHVHERWGICVSAKKFIKRGQLSLPS